MALKLRQLECLCEVVACGFNLSQAASRLCSSQPTVSRQLQLLEEALGFPVLLRGRNAIKGLTREGTAAYERAQRIVHEARQLRRLRVGPNADAGSMTIATTHFHARFTLLGSIRRLRRHYAHLSFSILSGSTEAIHQAVLNGRADVGLCAAQDDTPGELVAWPCFEIRRLIITPPAHPLLRSRRPSLGALARYPFITYDPSVSAGWRILDAFAAEGLAPNVVLSAAGAEVIKAYVAGGVGIAVIQEQAFDPAKDNGIEAIPADHLFAPVTALAIVRRGSVLPAYVRDFVLGLAPHLRNLETDRGMWRPRAVARRH
jgi:LysR family cys regulon transcriptional activator